MKSLRRAVADLRARLFTEGVEGAPVNMQTYGGDLVGMYAALTEMMRVEVGLGWRASLSRGTGACLYSSRRPGLQPFLKRD